MEEEEETSSNSDDDTTASPSSCFALLTLTCTKQASAGKLPELHDSWRESQRSTATQISRQLKSKWALDALIDAHLAKLRVHYTRSMLPAHPTDVPRLLLSPWIPTFVTASLSWLGDTWRPSAILSLVGATVTSPLSPRSRRRLAGSIRRFRVEEAVLDGEMAEYQSMSVLNLRRAEVKIRKGTRGKMEILRGEMKKVEGVIERAQKLRYRAVEAAVRGGILDERQAAEFLVAMAGVEEAVQRQAAKWQARAGAVVIEVQAFDAGVH